MGRFNKTVLSYLIKYSITVLVLLCPQLLALQGIVVLKKVLGPS